LSSPLGKLTMMLLLAESLLHLSDPTRWLTCRGNQPYRKMTGAIPGQVKPVVRRFSHLCLICAYRVFHNTLQKAQESVQGGRSCRTCLANLIF
jgi:hypothetical protein